MTPFIFPRFLLLREFFSIVSRAVVLILLLRVNITLMDLVLHAVVKARRPSAYGSASPDIKCRIAMTNTTVLLHILCHGV